MRWRAAVLALPLLLCCATWTQTGRLVDDPCVHVGVRPASDGFGDVATTFQVTTDWPQKCYAAGVDGGHDGHQEADAGLLPGGLQGPLRGEPADPHRP